ncbi:hypothetical protein QR78_07075 [Methylobacterium indicum]|uniref:Uncharacterized protein n=1 Tax=Methylobacterium indicum TaxID=1775910 RepID=A0ABR5HIJ5_9HYPH|nr:hypothetical protein QR78_07075 [Methylobacterium indicum]KMO26542.1 hypothetical protein QR79_01920 [Methylobacterium indicum]
MAIEPRPAFIARPPIRAASALSWSESFFFNASIELDSCWISPRIASRDFGLAMVAPFPSAVDSAG